MDSLRPFAIETDGIETTVTVDGEEVSRVRSLRFNADAGIVPSLTIEQYARGAISGTAFVDYIADTKAPADVVRALDPAALRQRVAGQGLSGSDDVYACCIDAIAAMLDEAT